MTRLRAAGWTAALLGLVTVLGVSAPVGAMFTADAPPVATASVGAATIADLAGGAASRTADGVASVEWTSPTRADAAAYTVTRTLAGTEATITPTLGTADGATGFTDDLTRAATLSSGRFDQIVSGFTHGCGLSTGKVACWGAANLSQNGGTQDTRQPQAVAGLAGAVSQLDAGNDHTCALLVDGTAQCWGDNLSGQLGASTTGRTTATPVTVQGLAGPVAALSAGGAFTCALLTDGSVQCWGSNYAGQLASTTGVGSSAPRGPVTVPGLSGVTAIAAGAQYACALLSDASVQCWGDNYSGQLGRADGNGSTYGSAQPAPRPVASIPSTPVGIAAGGGSTCVVLADGGVACWGRNEYGELGNGTSTGGSAAQPVPQRVTGLTGATTVSVGTAHACALVAPNGVVRCWGWNYNGQVGVVAGFNSAVHAGHTTPVAVGLHNMTSLSTGMYQSCTTAVDGGGYCWGRNHAGQLGSGSPMVSTWQPHSLPRSALPQNVVCPVDWIVVGQRCAPGPDVTVSYRVAHTVAGWSPATALAVDAEYRSSATGQGTAP